MSAPRLAWALHLALPAMERNPVVPVALSSWLATQVPWWILVVLAALGSAPAIGRLWLKYKLAFPVIAAVVRGDRNLADGEKIIRAIAALCDPGGHDRDDTPQQPAAPPPGSPATGGPATSGPATDSPATDDPAG